MDDVKKIVHILAIASYFLVTIYAIICIPMVFGLYPVVVLSGSMEPQYRTGSVIYYKKIPNEELKVDDVITFLVDEDKYVSHRIVSIKDEMIETKGDANNVSDVNKVPFENVKGKVMPWSIPYLGYYVQSVNNHLLVIIIVTIIVLVSEFLFSNEETFDINKRSEKNE